MTFWVCDLKFEMEERNLLIDESKLNGLDENKKPVFIFEWLQVLDKVLGNLSSSAKQAKSEASHREQQTLIRDKEAVRKCQKSLVAQLTGLIQTHGPSIGPTSRQLIANCLVGLFTVGDTFLLFETINK